MPYKISIPVTDSECATSFGVEIKRQSDMLYQPLEDQFALPIVIDSLEDSVDYNVRITRRCCSGITSPPVVVDITGMVAQPTNVAAFDMSGMDVYVEWDAAPLADSYEVERDTDPYFPSPTSVYSGVFTNFTDASVGSGTFYYRVWSVQAGKVNSDPVVTSIQMT